LALKAGLKGLYFIGVADKGWIPEKYGFDGVVEHEPSSMWSRLPDRLADRLFRRLTGRDRREIYKRLRSLPTIYHYRELVPNAILKEQLPFDYYPCVVPNWDNTPRSGLRGVVFHESTPELYQVVLREAVERAMRNDPDKRLVFIKSWNEWAEGNHLEPDHRFGKAYLEITRAEVSRREQRAGNMMVPAQFADRAS